MGAQRVISVLDAPVAELADALDLGSSALWRESSSLSGRTNSLWGSGDLQVPVAQDAANVASCPDVVLGLLHGALTVSVDGDKER